MMRFEYDNDGYVSCILYGCYTGSCAEYTGRVPTEPEVYESMDDWADRAITQAYYLNSQGNLTYDAGRAAEISGGSDTPYTPEYFRQMGFMDAIYPVGSIYMSIIDTSPEILFGGVWSRIQDRFLLAAGSSYGAGNTGGAGSYNLLVEHKHVAPLGYSGTTAVGAIAINGTVSTGSGKTYRTAKVDYSGSSLSSNITALYTGNATVSATIPTIPPYLAVYIWRRLA